MEPRQFIQIIAPIAQKLHREGSPIFPSVRIAQSALETGWKIPSWNNMVGLKVGNGKTNQYWRGQSVNRQTWEVYNEHRVDTTANFRAYHSIEDSFRDQDLLFNLKRYEGVREAKSPTEQAYKLYESGYATDPLYPQKILAIIAQYGLRQYDQMDWEKGEEYMLNPEDANKIIRFLSAGWFIVQGNKQAEAEFNRLANELRKASGQPPQ